MVISQLVFSALMSILAYGMVVLAIVKIFSVSSQVAEIKEMLRDIQRKTEDPLSDAFSARAQSPESLVRAVNTSSYQVPDVEGFGRVSKQDVAK